MGALTHERQVNGGVPDDALPRPVPAFDLAKLDDARSQALKDLLHQSHVGLATLRDPNLSFHTHMPHLLGSGYYLGATPEKLQEMYEEEAATLKPIECIPTQNGLTQKTWRSCVTKKEYCVEYTRFFDEEIVKHKGNWKEVLSEYLCSSSEPIINGLCGGLGHPFIQLAYAYEFESKEVAAEALSLACTEYDYVHKFIDKPPPDTSTYKSARFNDILSQVLADQRLDGHLNQPGFMNIMTILQTREDVVLEHWNAFTLEDFRAQFENACEDAVLVAVGTADSSTGYDFFFAHVLTVAHALRVVMPYFPPERRDDVFKQYWLFTLLIYIAQLRPPLTREKIDSIDLQQRDWSWVQEKALTGRWCLDSHYVKVVRALKVGAETWPGKDTFNLKAAVKYVTEFDGWVGFGPMPDFEH